jgi:hypothetical protein
MARRALYTGSTSLLLLGLSGCPVTDDYYLLSDDAGSGSSAAGSSSSAGHSASGSASGGGKAQAGSSPGGTPAAGTSMGGASSVGGDAGAPNSGQAGVPGGDAGSASMAGTGGSEPCAPSTERCNGHDDDCDDVVDEFACLSNCSGFGLPSNPEHGYMFCTSARKANYWDARKACEDQDMRLAWLDSAEENAAVAQKLDSLGSDSEVLFGATDQGNEGDWIWFGGEQFWKGAADGVVVGGRYNNWVVGTPNNANNNEDCALIIVDSGNWGDRSCYATYPYVCEQPD